jgi:hypothetical protein
MHQITPRKFEMLEVKKIGERWEYGAAVFWPEAGAIRVWNKTKLVDPDPLKDESTQTVGLKQWRKRVLAQYELVQHIVADQHIIDPGMGVSQKAQYARNQRALLQAMIDAGKIAEKQGDPQSRAVLAEVARHANPNNSRIVVPDIETN